MELVLPRDVGAALWKQEDQMIDADFRMALMRIQMEYLEMPELKLTLWQAMRLWALPMATCRAAMAALVATGFLLESRGGSFFRTGRPPVDVQSLDAATWMSMPEVAR